MSTRTIPLDRPPRMPVQIRCSDGEREDVVSAIAVAAGEGRLSLAEADDRLSHVYAARYRHELEALTADLPNEPLRDRRAPGQPGWEAIAFLAWRQLLDDVSSVVGRDGSGAGRPLRGALVVMVAALLFAAMLHGLGDGGHLGHYPHH